MSELTRMFARQPQLVELRLNGKAVSGYAEPRTLLTDFLRHELGATGTHVGCEHGVCGACTLRVDGKLARACLMLAVQVDGLDIETVEGLAPDRDRLSTLQAAFRRHHALQCGYCTPGILMSMDTLLTEESSPSRERVTEVLSGHLCRCTGYEPIIDATLEAAEQLAVDRARIDEAD